MKTNSHCHEVAHVWWVVFEGVLICRVVKSCKTHTHTQHTCVGRTELGTPCDIAFSMVEGDFQAFQGIWRMQRLGEDGCCLSYALFVRPQVWLPVRLIQVAG